MFCNFFHKLLIGLTCCGLGLVIIGCEKPAPDQGTKADTTPPAHLVETVTLRHETIGTRHERTGSLRTRRLVRIYSQEEGRITRLPFFEGDRVAKGDLLLSLDDEILKAELAKTQATLEQARLDLKRIRDLVKKRVASEDELARASTALEVAMAEKQLLETRIAHTRILAPFDGVISERFKEPGDVVPRHSQILTLADPASLVTELSVSELLLPHVKTGDEVEVRIDALGDRRFPGKILRIHPELDPRTRQGKLEVVLEPVPPQARAGQFARVTLLLPASERLLIPFSALRRDREGEFVYRLGSDDKAHKAPVRSGIHIGSQVEILEGLTPDQQVITRGFLGLADGKTVKPVTLTGP
jgi:RND family efflux transporter MFP subunit